MNPRRDSRKEKAQDIINIVAEDHCLKCGFEFCFLLSFALISNSVLKEEYLQPQTPHSGTLSRKGCPPCHAMPLPLCLADALQKKKENRIAERRKDIKMPKIPQTPCYASQSKPPPCPSPLLPKRQSLHQTKKAQPPDNTST
jgi:hypothetical protein